MRKATTLFFCTSFGCLCLGLLLWGLVLPQTALAAEVVDRIVAVVNGRMITLAEVNRNLSLVLKSEESAGGPRLTDQELQDLRRKILDKMIDDMLLEQEAERFKIEVSTTEIQNYVSEFKTQNRLTEEQLSTFLNQQGLTLDGWKSKIKENMLRSRLLAVMVQRKVVITDEEITAYYEAHKHELTGSGSGLRLSMIVFPPDRDPDAIRQDILGGRSTFAEAARRYSIGPAAETGGDLGEVQLRDLVPELQSAATQLQPGEVSRPFRLGDKVAIILLQKSGGVGGEVKPLEEVREQIKAILGEPKMEQIFSDYTKRLRDQALIDIRL